MYLSATARLTHGVRNPVAAWLDDLGVFGLRSHEKRVPDEVFRQPVEAIEVFLRHLWATDGCLWAGSDRAYPAIRYDTTSEELGRGVVSLLLRLGITARHSVVSMGTKGQAVASDRDQRARSDGPVPLVRGCGRERRSNARARDPRHDWPTMKANTNRDTLPREAWKGIVSPAMAARWCDDPAASGTTRDELLRLDAHEDRVSRETRGACRRDRRVARAPVALAQSDVYWDEVVDVTAGRRGGGLRPHRRRRSTTSSPRTLLYTIVSSRTPTSSPSSTATSTTTARSPTRRGSPR